MEKLVKNKKMLLGLLLLGVVFYYVYNQKHEDKEKAGLLPADKS